MERYKRSTVFGAALILFALALRLILWQGAQAMRFPQETMPSGNLLRPSANLQLPQQTEPETAPQAPAPTQPPGREFTVADLQKTRLQYAWDCPHRPDLQALLLKSLDWDLLGSEPKVLILHTHASESYTRQPGQDYMETAPYRTLDEAYNMVAVGAYLAALLEAAGISVLHDRQIHDYPSYPDAYANSRAAAQSYLDQYPSICLVLDLHRDAAENQDGSQYATEVDIGGQTGAQLMLVVGTDASGNSHPHWQENLALALKLQVLLEERVPGITRQSILRAQRFNQDLSAGALIVEVGTAGNTLEEALRAIPVLAQAIEALIHGANQYP